ncbi:MAG: fibrobacter succinogenes major paralogous domain-containing protein [Bacteroidales bacterium]|nr:fibrobacter succinogenes major paralogous domain-containing protein [Bacteroidales bacterium]
MKTSKLFIAAISAIVLFASCTKENNGAIEKAGSVSITLSAGMTDASDTKANLGDKTGTSYPMCWEAEGETVAAVITDAEGIKTTVVSEKEYTVSQDSKTADFKFIIAEDVAMSAKSVMFVSPASCVVDGAISYDALAEQTPSAAGKADPEACIISSGEIMLDAGITLETLKDVSFTSAVAFANMTVKDAALTGAATQVAFTANGEKSIAGISSTITVDLSKLGISAGDNFNVIFAVSAGNEAVLGEGFSVTVSDNNGSSVNKEVKAGTLVFNAGKVSEFSVAFAQAAKGLRLDLSQFNLDDEFDKCLVQKVMNGDKQVAELDREFIKDVDSDNRRTVIYPMGSDGKADLTKGIDLKTGGSLVWTKKSGTTADAVALGEGSGKVNVVYVNADGSLSLTSSATEFDELTLAADILVDKRGSSETNSYKIVKIGTQYWMAENLKTLRGFYGTTTYKMNYPADDNFLGVGGYGYGKLNGSEDQTQVLYDAFVAEGYFGYGRSGSSSYKALSIEPEGWIVPEKDDFTKLKNNVNVSSDWGNRLKDELYESSPKGISNITGFSANGTGYYDSSSNWTANTIYYWSKTDYNAMGTQVYALKFTMSGATGSITYINNDYGCYIRFIRQ